MPAPDLSPLQLLEALLDPIHPEEFVQSHWDRKPLLVKGDPGKVERLVGQRLDPDRWEALTEALEQQEREIKSVYAARKADYDGLILEHRDHGDYIANQDHRRPTRYIRRAEIADSMRAGHSVQLNGLENLVFGSEDVSHWARFADRIKAALHFPGEFYLGATRSPQGARFHSHYDPGPGFIFQTHGRKRYTVGSAPVAPWPNRKGYQRPTGGFKYAGRLEDPLKSTWEEEDPEALLDTWSVEMAPGDLLYLPAGVVHQTEALEESIAVLMLPPSVRFGAVLNELLDGALGHLEDWRCSPVWVGEDPADGSPTGTWVRFNERILREVRNVLRGISSDGYELTRAWKALAGRSLVAERLETPSRDLSPLRPRDALRVNHQASFLLAGGQDRNGETHGTFYLGTRKVEAHGPWASLFRGLPRHRTFEAQEAMAWRGRFRRFDWEGTRACLEALLAEGILVRA